MKSRTLLGLTLTGLTGLFLLLPGVQSQPFIATGDHGRDLYAAAAILQGEVPYRDFWWVYGPLMPYYYALVAEYQDIANPN
jgi:hypothetical protein